MVTVDDLVISLTIKETGKLGQLKKQLDALVGKRGEKLGRLGRLGADPALKHDVNYIRRRMDYLVPVVSPRAHERAKVRIYAGSTKLLIKEFKTEIASYLTDLKEKDMTKLYKDFNVPLGNADALLDKMEGVLEDYEGEAEGIHKGLIAGESALRFLNAINNMMRRVREEGGERLTAFRKITEWVPEAQERWERILEELDIVKKGQAHMYKIRQDVIEGNGILDDWVGHTEEAQKEFEDLKKYFEGKRAVYVPLMTALKDLGYEDKLEDILEDMNEIKNDVKLQNLIKAMFSLAKKGKLDLWLPRSMKEFLRLSVKVKAGATPAVTGGGLAKIDVSLLQNAERMIKVFPEYAGMLKEALKTGFAPLELKGVLKYSDSIQEQMRKYYEIFGDSLIIIARQVTEPARKMLERIGIKNIITKPSIREAEKVLGIERQITDLEETRTEIEDLTKKLTEHKDKLEGTDITEIKSNINNINEKLEENESVGNDTTTIINDLERQREDLESLLREKQESEQSRNEIMNTLDELLKKVDGDSSKLAQIENLLKGFKAGEMKTTNGFDEG